MNVQIFDEMMNILRSINGCISTNHTKVIQDGMALYELIATAKKEAQETEDALLHCDKIITMARNALSAAGVPDIEQTDRPCGRALPIHERIGRLSKSMQRLVIDGWEWVWHGRKDGLLPLVGEEIKKFNEYRDKVNVILSENKIPPIAAQQKYYSEKLADLQEDFTRVILALESKQDEVEALRAEVIDWICEKCRHVFLGGPKYAKFETVLCPDCKGATLMPRGRFIERELEREKKEKEAAVEDYKRMQKLLGIVDSMMNANDCVKRGCGWMALKAGITVETERSKRI